MCFDPLIHIRGKRRSSLVPPEARRRELTRRVGRSRLNLLKHTYSVVLLMYDPKLKKFSSLKFTNVIEDEHGVCTKTERSREMPFIRGIVCTDRGDSPEVQSSFASVHHPFQEPRELCGMLDLGTHQTNDFVSQRITPRATASLRGSGLSTVRHAKNAGAKSSQHL